MPIMDSKRKKKITDARFVATELNNIGEHVKADMVTRLVNAHISLADTASKLWHDNMRLREQIEGKE